MSKTTNKFAPEVRERAVRMCVDAARVASMDEFNDLFQQANAHPGPFVIELAIA